MGKRRLIRECKCSRMQVQRAREPSEFVFMCAFLFSVGQAGGLGDLRYFGPRLLPKVQRLNFANVTHRLWNALA